MNGELLIPILVPLGFFALVFGVVYMIKRENMAMIEKGMNPKQFANRPQPYTNLKYGLLLVGSGIGLVLAYILDLYLVPNKDDEAIYFALIAIGGGLGLIISYNMEMKELRGKGTNVSALPSEL